MQHQVFTRDEPAVEALTMPVVLGRLQGAKRGYATRRIDLSLAAGVIVGDARPRARDLVLAEVAGLGQHRRLEDPTGRRATLFEGDEILVVYGDRYAPDQFEAHVPDDLAACELVAAGGIAARVLRKNDRMRSATRVVPIGLVTDAVGRRLSTRDFALAESRRSESRPLVIAVVGSSMNAGKTTTLAALARGERLAGRRVGAIKATGTGAGCDAWAYLDAGAAAALDFTDAGHPSTHRLTDGEREQVLEILIHRMAADGMETILVEVADGLLFPETARLVVSPKFRRLVDGVVYTAADAMGALAGADWLRRRGLPLLAISGAVTASPVAMSEVAAETDLPVLTTGDLVAGRCLRMAAEPCAA